MEGNILSLHSHIQTSRARNDQLDATALSKYKNNNISMDNGLHRTIEPHCLPNIDILRHNITKGLKFFVNKRGKCLDVGVQGSKDQHMFSVSSTVSFRPHAPLLCFGV
jgi:hypothetical protein